MFRIPQLSAERLARRRELGEEESVDKIRRTSLGSHERRGKVRRALVE